VCFNKWAVKENASSWNGGATYHPQTGHKMVMTDDFHKSPKSRVYRPEHRVAVENYIGRKLEKNGEPIWHLNGIPDDNRMENLYVFSSRREMSQANNGTIPFPVHSNVEQLKLVEEVRAAL
jgi:hypothetical protein